MSAGSIQGDLACGVDVGSTLTKAILLDADGAIVASAIADTGSDISGAAMNVHAILRAEYGCRPEDIGSVVGTGYGRYRIEFGDMRVTEISCHARGAAWLFPGTGTVLDMGGQDTKAIRVRADGGVIDFRMNDKCAAGTGRFLSAAATLLEMTLDELASIACASSDPVAISNTCAVFAESEILGWIARGRGVEDILLGAHRAIAARSVALLRRVGLEQTVTFTGGVSLNACMVREIERLVGSRINVCPRSHFAGALGAALFARDRIMGRRGVVEG